MAIECARTKAYMTQIEFLICCFFLSNSNKMAIDFNRIFGLTALTALLLVFSVHLSYSCNEQVCASIVSKCMLTQSCKCDSQNYSCCVECFKCLGHLQLECCSCLGMLWIGQIQYETVYKSVCAFRDVSETSWNEKCITSITCWRLGRYSRFVQSTHRRRWWRCR